MSWLLTLDSCLYVCMYVCETTSYYWTFSIVFLAQRFWCVFAIILVALCITIDNDFRERTWIKLILSNPNLKPLEPHDLIYFEDSPSFCEPDSGISFKGTVHRECNAMSLEIDGCDIMCCGRGFKTDIYQREDRCNCIFHWCCRVTCEICLKAIARNSCL